MLIAAGMLAILGGCSGVQSAVDPAGRGAAVVADLFWVMLAGAAVIWALVMALVVYATRTGHREHSVGQGMAVVIGGGVVAPVIILSALLVWGLRMMPTLRVPDRTPALRVAVSGERFWWRVRYAAAGQVVESANELRLPVGGIAEVALTSPDVIHSFWIPNLAGKVDVIPGRTNRLILEPTRAGVFRGQCAEFCGTSHALMAFTVVVMEPAAYAGWLAAEAGQALPAAGAALFQATGCGGCHTVRGTAANGEFGPDLTHIGSRRTIAAATLANDRAALMRWIGHTQDLKPEANMPSYDMLSRQELAGLADYLGALK